MDADLLYKVMLVIIQVFIIVVGGYFVNYIRIKIGTENFNKYYSMIKTIVMSVEQVFGAGNGPDKKAEAVQLIKKMLGNKLSDEQINSLIEAAVFEMNSLIKQGQA